MGDAQSVDTQEIVAKYRRGWPVNSFLSQLTTRTLREFLTKGRIIQFSNNETLIDENLAETSVFLLLSACVKVTARLDQGGHALLAVRVGGDMVGELAAMDGGSRSATVKACGRDPVVAAVLTQSDFVSLLSRYPEAAMTLNTAIGRKLRSATRRRIDYSGCTPRVRLARALVELAEDYGHQQIPASQVLVAINLTQLELGTLVGVAEVTAQRALRELRKDGLINTSGRRPIIRDINALRVAAHLAP
ncbi:MAG: Crp/Fnr family transcriptional regulator [Pseudonocardiales bacterium]|nr:Crp/Fnr family transcriptional regulator [Pseudonocardiales bacterium]MBV9730915.1 Crp/Fnr family transcriptional regulator [Pseudonocardiales bacterium]